MTPTAFQLHVGRLVNNYGKVHYSEERVKLLWREVQHLSPEWMERTVDRFIGESRYAPLLPEFREEAAKERERNHSMDRQRSENDAKRFFRVTSIQGDDLQMIMSGIIRRISGDLSDDDFAAIQRLLASVAASKTSATSSCRLCHDEGTLIVNQGGYECIFKCSCPKGSMDQRHFPVWGQPVPLYRLGAE